MSHVRIGAAAVAGALIALLTPAMAAAHGLVGRADLPIPDWLFGWAAAAVLAISFFAFAALWQRPRLETAVPKRRIRVPVAVEVLAGALGVAGLIFLLWAGFSGTQVATDNIVPTFVYVFFWSFLPFLSAVFGDLFRAVNPWRAIGRAGGWLTGRASGEQMPPPFDYPEWLGRWPAVALLFGFGFLELVATSGQDPDMLATMMLAYAVIQLAGMTLFGVERWLERGDAFNIYFNAFSRISPLTVRDGYLSTRPPLSGLTEITALRGTVVFFCAAIGITAFDGASEGALWQDGSMSLQRFFADFGFSTQTALQIAFTVGLIASIFIITGIYRTGVAGMRRGGIDKSGRDLAQMFAPSLVPIVLAYVLAHYFSFIMFQGQALWFLLSDPLGEGSNWFGAADGKIVFTWLSASAIWYFQAAILVIGHAAALAVAHDKALAVFGKARAAVRSQVWMLIVMVGFTNLGLWLLSQANG
ncbi:MAG: fenitrothion hydrolase [Solirubrobacterales bacterium]